MPSPRLLPRSHRQLVLGAALLLAATAVWRQSTAADAANTGTAASKRGSTSSTLNAGGKRAKAAKTAPVSFNVSEPYAAPEFTELQNWVNSKPLTLAQLRGKVVLINFWTFGCYNCQNTLPHVRDLYAKYHDQGFEIVGLHAPEFDYEKEAANVAKAVKEDGIEWPVAQDNTFRTWRRYKNGFWPSFFYIDRSGLVRHTHIGEGSYEKQDAVVAALLAESPGAPAPALVTAK